MQMNPLLFSGAQAALILLSSSTALKMSSWAVSDVSVLSSQSKETKV